MPSHPVPGFVKKRTAAQRFQRSPRQLTRDITLALEMRDEKVLPHLCLLTEDGEVIEGEDTTSDLVKKLRDDGRNPMWYLRKSWLEETFGRRGDEPIPAADIEPENEPAPQPQQRQQTMPVSDELTEMLKESVRELKQDKENLLSQLKIKDEQIAAANDRWKESNVLTKDLHSFMLSMQRQLGQGAPAPASAPVDDSAQAGEVVNVTTDVEPRPEEGTAAAQSADASKPAAAAPAKKPTTKQRPAKKKQPERKHAWYETPTLSRVARSASRLLSR